MTAKHTPGPWHVWEGNQYHEVSGYCRENSAPLAYVRYNFDARLISAAPELLAALEGAEYAMQIMAAHVGYQCGDFSAIRAKARAAIAKAKGA